MVAAAVLAGEVENPMEVAVDQAAAVEDPMEVADPMEVEDPMAAVGPAGLMLHVQRRGRNRHPSLGCRQRRVANPLRESMVAGRAEWNRHGLRPAIKQVLAALVRLGQTVVGLMEPERPALRSPPVASRRQARVTRFSQA